MSAEFTPGPWSATFDDGDWYISAHVDGLPTIIADLGPMAASETVEANARLIATAPKLYEALVSAFNRMGTTTDCLNSGEPSRHHYAEQRLQREMDQMRGVLSEVLRGPQ